MERLLTIAKEIDGIKTGARNRGLLQNEQRPAIVILDGDESARTIAPARNLQFMAPTINRARPEIYVLLPENRPAVDNTGQVGADLNAWRIKICDAIAGDSQLQSIVGTNGGIIYNGCVTDLKSGSSLTGQMRIDFLLDYPFIPTPTQLPAS